MVIMEDARTDEPTVSTILYQHGIAIHSGIARVVVTSRWNTREAATRRHRILNR